MYSGKKVCCVTGHRPDAFPWKNNTEDRRFHILLKRIEDAVDTALLSGAGRFICGNALGVDVWTAQIILEKRNTNPDIYLEIALPFASHNSGFQSCLNIQKQADWTHVVATEGCRRAAFFQRDKYMVDCSDMIIAVYDNQTSRNGGTQRTLTMAKEKGLEIIQVSWEDTLLTDSIFPNIPNSPLHRITVVQNCEHQLLMKASALLKQNPDIYRKWLQSNRRNWGELISGSINEP